MTAPTTKKKFTALTLGLEDVYFTWSTVSNAATARYANVVDTLKEYVAVYFQDQATMATKVTEELKAPTFVKSDRPSGVYWAEESQTRKTNNIQYAGSKTDNAPKLEDWEHKLKVDKYLEKYKTYKDGTKAWDNNKGKCYYLILQHCPLELKTKLKNSA